MKKKMGALVLSITMAAFCVPVQAAVDPGALVVQVRSDCAEPLGNCFSHPAEAIAWMSSTRKPNASAPLTVKIFPGVYEGAFDITCNAADGYTGHTSFEGSGNGQSILRRSTFNTPLNVDACTSMSFSNLTINGVGYGGVTWSGGGTSKWINVDVIGAGRGWYEPTCGAARGSHYWTGSRIVATAGFTVATPYVAGCDESWFFGSELTAIVPQGATGNGAVLSATEGGIAHVYGSVLRLFVDGPGSMYAVHVGEIGMPDGSVTGGEIHIHGTGIDVMSMSGRDITAIKVSGGGMLHANGAAYNLHSSGAITRLIKTPTAGHVSAPYQWGESQDAPAVATVAGADTAIVTDTADGQPHIVVSSANCASGWYDTTVQACR